MVIKLFTIKKKMSDKHGYREVKRNGEYKPEEQPEPNTDYDRAQLQRRFMIYVHAKMMIEMATDGGNSRVKYKVMDVPVSLPYQKPAVDKPYRLLGFEDDD